MKIDNGLIVDESTSPPTCCGYIFDFTGHGAFAPSGQVKVNGSELTKEQIDTHNKLLAQAELEAFKKYGHGVLYVHRVEGTATRGYVGTWASTPEQRIPIDWAKRSNHFVPGAFSRVYRTDVWFRFDGSQWHGVNIGDNNIVRVKRLKNKKGGAQ